MANDELSLYLDPQIRDWVLFPITVVMILVGILRHYVMMLLQTTPKAASLAAIRESKGLARAQILRATSAQSPIPPAFYKSMSRELRAAFAAGVFLKDGPQSAAANPSNVFTDPAALEGMTSGMKTQLAVMVPQMIIMGWINFFFQGFVLIRLPFPLTLGFKSMLQRGIETRDMDVRWVSSLSWYFLNFFGLNGLFQLLLGTDNSSNPDTMLSPFAAAGSAPQAGPAVDYPKLFKTEGSNLEFAEGVHHWIGKDVEERILRKYGKLGPSTN